MAKCKGYAGKISNAGPQKVEAVFPASRSKGSKVTKGSDLRAGKKGGRK